MKTQGSKLLLLLSIAMLGGAAKCEKSTPPTGGFCGGIVNIACPETLHCELDSSSPDSGGTCQAD